VLLTIIYLHGAGKLKAAVSTVRSGIITQERNTYQHASMKYLYHIDPVEDKDDPEGSLDMHLHTLLPPEDGAEAQRACIVVHGYQPFFYVELPSVFTAEEWRRVRVNELRAKLLEMARLHECTDDPCMACARQSQPWRGTFRPVWKKKLYHVQRRTWHAMLQMCFPTQQQRRMVFYRLHDKVVRVGMQKWTLTLHEAEAPPILQFCTDLALPTTGWIECAHTHVEVRNNSASDQIRALPGQDASPPPPVLVAVDIEVYSHNEKRMPTADHDEDAVFQIALVRSTGEGRLLHVGPCRDANASTEQNDRFFEFPDERALLLGFAAHVRDMGPHVLCGYNIFGFDFPYLMARAKRWGVDHQIARLGWSGHVCPVKEVQWSSSAYRNQHFTLWQIDGRISLDLLPIVRRDYKFSNYRLKTVATAFLGQTKDPVTPQDIFRAYRKHLQGDATAADDLAVIGRYCIQDARLVLRLCDKLNQWIGLCEMARICRVAIPTLFLQGQQIKVYSQIYHHCHAHDILVQTPPSENRATKYAGATVFPPKPGIYDNVVPFDFASLYPTTIIAYNIDYSTIVPPSRTDIADDACHVIQWEEHTCCAHDTTAYTPATHPGYTKCGWHRFRFLKSPRGVVPTLLQTLLDARAQTKKQMKAHGKDTTAYQVLDKRQLAYKVSANSMYGAMGVQKGFLPFLPGAMCITAKGRESIQCASKLVQSWGGEIVYGDSVSGSTPVLLRHDGCDRILLCDVATAAQRCAQHERQHFETQTQTQTRWCPATAWSVWSDGGWTPLHHVYRHEHQDPLVDVVTPDGVVTVTQHHSLVLHDAAKTSVTPQEWVDRDHPPLLQMPLALSQQSSVSEVNATPHDAANKAWQCRWTRLGFQCGFFLRWGWLSKERSYAFASMLPTADPIVAEIAQMRTVTELRVHGPAFLRGFARVVPTDKASITLTMPTALCDAPAEAALMLQWVHLVAAVTWGWRLTWETDRCVCLGRQREHTINDALVPRATTRCHKKSTNNQVVYDLTTGNGHFAAGVGALVVHNTDSIYCSLPESGDTKQLWARAKAVEERFVEHFPPPMRLAFEDKIYTRFLILTKKRYMALTADADGRADAALTIRGVLLARRDNCAWVRRSYERVVRRIFDGADARAISKDIADIFLELMRRQLPLGMFTITKLLSEDYAIRPFLWDAKKLSERCREWGWTLRGPFPLAALTAYATRHQLPTPTDRVFSEQQWEPWCAHLRTLPTCERADGADIPCLATRFLTVYALRSLPSHVQLASRLAQRGKPVESGARMEFMMARPYWQSLQACARAKVADRVEDPAFVSERRPLVDVDVAYYASALLTPMDQILGIVFQRPLAADIWRVHLCYDRVMEQFRKMINTTPPVLGSGKQARQRA